MASFNGRDNSQYELLDTHEWTYASGPSAQESMTTRMAPAAASRPKLSRYHSQSLDLDWHPILKSKLSSAKSPDEADVGFPAKGYASRPSAKDELDGRGTFAAKDLVSCPDEANFLGSNQAAILESNPSFSESSESEFSCNYEGVTFLASEVVRMIASLVLI